MNEILAVVLVCLISEVATKETFANTEDEEDDEILSPK